MASGLQCGEDARVDFSRGTGHIGLEGASTHILSQSSYQLTRPTIKSVPMNTNGLLGIKNHELKLTMMCRSS